MNLTFRSVRNTDRHKQSTIANQKKVVRKNQNFVDLGCGNGKLLVQAYIELPYLHRIVGIDSPRISKYFCSPQY